MREWSNEATLLFINVYENYPVLWDRDHACYKIPSKKVEAWQAISRAMKVSVRELKKKMTILLATYRKVRQKQCYKTGPGPEDFDATPMWFAFSAFEFLHDKYQPKLPSDETFEKGENLSDLTKSSETSDFLPLTDDEAPDAKKKKLFLSPQIINKKYSSNHQQYKPKFHWSKDDCDSYGEYIADFLRNLDLKTRAHVKKDFGEIIFKVETGSYLSLPPQIYAAPDYVPFDALLTDVSRANSNDSAQSSPSHIGYSIN